MRTLLLLLFLGCAATEPAPQTPARRALVTDSLPFLVPRAQVRAWHEHNDWCLARQWPQSDEFVVCNRQPYLNSRTPPQHTFVRYDAAQRSISYATFAPVPCRMYGRCDGVYGRTWWRDDHDFVDHEQGLLDNLAQRGRNEPPEETAPPEMQTDDFRALAQELDTRFGARTWADAHGYGATWATRTAEIGLFVAGKGGWVVETHELRPAVVSAAPGAT
ncbi:MAG: hypothetical protein JO257_25475 [Deltaproteobacteria bacterium]|nr:hypothetical protein [Deltaproteobacteria bacterium]